MDELEAGDISNPEVREIKFYQEFIKGNFGLAITYWMFGVAVTIMFTLAYKAVPSDTVAYAIAVVFIIYLFALLVAIWNAAEKYSGPKVWAVLALLIVFVGLLRNISTLLFM